MAIQLRDIPRWAPGEHMTAAKVNVWIDMLNQLRRAVFGLDLGQSPALLPGVGILTGFILTVDGGANGTPTTVSSYTYTMTLMTGVTVATKMSPYGPCNDVGPIFVPTPPILGIGWRNMDSTFTLWDAGEEYSSGVCT